MNPFNEYESQKGMAVRRVTKVELIDRMVAYGRELEAEIVKLKTLVDDLQNRVMYLTGQETVDGPSD